MSRAASKPLPSKKTNRKPGPAGVRRRALRRGAPTASEELHDQADPLDELGDLETEDDEALVAGLEDSSGRRIDRRRRPDRRSDPHLPDADGRDPHAQPRARR